MNKMMTTVLAFGAGMAAYNIAKRTNVMSNQTMKKWQKQIRRAMS